MNTPKPKLQAPRSGPAPEHPLADICKTLGLPPRKPRGAGRGGPWPFPLAGAVCAPPWKPGFDPVAALRTFLVGAPARTATMADGKTTYTVTAAVLPGRLSPDAEADAREWLALVRQYREKTKG